VQFSQLTAFDYLIGLVSRLHRSYPILFLVVMLDRVPCIFGIVHARREVRESDLPFDYRLDLSRVEMPTAPL
jgi:hypothetical protein